MSDGQTLFDRLEKSKVELLEKKLRLYEAREAMLDRISLEVNNVIDLNNFLRATVNELGRVLEVDRCDFSKPIGHLNFEVVHEFRRGPEVPSGLGRRFHLGGFAHRYHENKPEPLVLADAQSFRVHESLREWCEQIRTLSLMLVPVTFQRELLGVIGLHHCTKQHNWHDNEIGFVRSLAQHIAIAHQYVRLYTEKEKEVEITKSLLEIAIELNSRLDYSEKRALIQSADRKPGAAINLNAELDFSEITSFIIDKSIDLLKADCGCFAVLDPADRILHFKSLRTRAALPSPIDRTTVQLADLPHIYNSINSGQIFFLSDPERDVIARTYLREIFHGRAALVVPITIGDTVFGTLNLIWTRVKPSITADQIKLIEGIRNQTAIALENSQLALEVLQLRRELKGVRASGVIVGQSPAIKKCIEMALYVADSSTTVLLQGESGTGKELIADFIYENSPRKGRPYVKINCGAIPETLLETELFGYEKGAFTDAKGRKKGKFEEADGGTLMLDEIGELSANAQVKLLRVLQDGQFTRVGGNELIKTDVRVIAATNVDLAGEVEKGTFRKDLYYRLNVYPINLPPLRERVDDIPLLAEHFLRIYSKKSGRNIAGISDDCLRLLKAYHWPGNVRELENAIERAVIVATGKSLTPEDLPETIRGAAAARRTLEVVIGSPLEEVEKKIILETLTYTGEDKAKAARLLKIGRKTLYRKLKMYREGKGELLGEQP